MRTKRLPKILLVDDEPLLLEGLCRGMRKEEFEIFTASSGSCGLEIISETDIEVVVSDEQMPGMRGSELFSQVRKRWPETVRIMLTGQATLDNAITAINEGEIFRFLTKPCNPAELAQTIWQAIQIRELTAKSSRLLVEYRKKQAALENMEAKHPGISTVERTGDGAIVIEDAPCDIEKLLEELSKEVGC